MLDYIDQLFGMDIFSEIRNLISQDKIAKAIEQLQRLDIGASFRDELLNIHSRLSSLKKEETERTKSQEYLEQKKNTIRLDLIDMISRLERSYAEIIIPSDEAEKSLRLPPSISRFREFQAGDQVVHKSGRSHRMTVIEYFSEDKVRCSWIDLGKRQEEVFYESELRKWVNPFNSLLNNPRIFKK